MLLTSFIVLTALGAGAWLLGHIFEYTGIAAIGAIILIAVGGAVVFTSLEVKSGETIERSYESVGNEPVETNTSVSNDYDRVEISTQFGGGVSHFSIGGLVMILGGLLMTQHLNEVRS